MTHYRKLIFLCLGFLLFLNTPRLLSQEFAAAGSWIITSNGTASIETIPPSSSRFFTTGQQGSAMIAAACGGLTLSSPLVIAIAGGTIVATGVYLLLDAIKERNNIKTKNTELKKQYDDAQQNGSATPPDDPNDGNDFFKSLKARADKIARTNRFGKMYRDPETFLWWSKDTTNHGGSCYKVFRECAKGFEWLFDADHLGNIIANKHKGPTGLYISYKEVIFLP